jgi:hypothetical protein
MRKLTVDENQVNVKIQVDYLGRKYKFEGKIRMRSYDAYEIVDKEISDFFENIWREEGVRKFELSELERLARKYGFEIGEKVAQ